MWIKNKIRKEEENIGECFFDVRRGDNFLKRWVILVIENVFINGFG